MSEKTMFYAGVGSRNTPANILADMQELASTLAELGFTLRSGGASGADKAFYTGAKESNGSAEIWVPWPRYGNVARADEYIIDYEPYWDYVSQFHNYWERCRPAVRNMHTRNLAILAGNLDAEDKVLVDFVVAWTVGGSHIGGTGVTLNMAEYLGIPIFNLYDPSALEQLAQFIEENYV